VGGGGEEKKKVQLCVMEMELNLVSNQIIYKFFYENDFRIDFFFKFKKSI
jgi:hypothetical protein